MKFDPYKFQSAAIDHAVNFLSTAERGQRQLYAAPTGCGKSVVELKVQEALQDCWIVTPREEIIDGMLEKLEAPDSADPLDYRISTPIRLRNRLLDGKFRPKYMVFDEAHHHNAESWQQLDLLTGLCPSVAYTASPYRGSPKGTRDFLGLWGEPEWLITYEEAVAEGYISMPSFEILPLVDDDIVEVEGGEFSVTSLEANTVDRMGDLADHAKLWHDGKLWTRSTVFAVPSSACAVRLQQELLRRHLPAVIVKSGTSRADRRGAFLATRNCITALIHINIVSEGVDMPFRRLIDLAPTLSPVNWVQKLGRITRPVAEGEKSPEYICTNRNIARHCYVLEGVVPVGAAVDSDRAFGPTSRAHTRVLGLEAVGRFKPTSVKLQSGLSAAVYSLSVLVENIVVEYCCVVHPSAEPIWATKVKRKKSDGSWDYGNWVAVDPPNDLRGFSSHTPGELRPKQDAWWKRSAAGFGLEVDQPMDRKKFQILPVLCNLGKVLR